MASVGLSGSTQIGHSLIYFGTVQNVLIIRTHIFDRVSFTNGSNDGCRNQQVVVMVVLQQVNFRHEIFGRSLVVRVLYSITNNQSIFGSSVDIDIGLGQCSQCNLLGSRSPRSFSFHFGQNFQNTP